MQKVVLFLTVIIFSFSCSDMRKNSIENTNTNSNKDANQINTSSEFYLKKNKNIEDYYLNIPDNGYFSCEFQSESNKEWRKKHIIKRNIKNGYLLATDSSDFTIELALFKDKKKQRDIIAVFSRSCNVGGQCPPQYHFWTLESGHWKNITDEVFEIDKITKQIETNSNSIIGFKLPEFGTNIIVINCDELTPTGITLPFSDGKVIFD